MKLKIPSPLSIALGLSLFVFSMAWIFTSQNAPSAIGYGSTILDYWYKGFWSMTGFTMQMVMILILGHIIALSKTVEKFVFWFIALFKTGASATAFIALATLLVAFFNWGLALIFGAVLARKMGVYSIEHNIKLNYPLVGAAGFCGLMFWHGGMSGSAPLAVAQSNHHLVDQIGVISTAETIFSSQNLLVSLSILILVPISFYLMAKRTKPSNMDAYELRSAKSKEQDLDKSKPNYLLMFFGLIMIIVCISKLFNSYNTTGDIFGAIQLDFINFLLYGLALLFMGNVHRFQLALDEATLSAAGILVQFPLYAGIMGIMKESGMMVMLAEWFVSVSNAETFPIFTYLSAALVNIFVPSGGGQWLVQGPVVVEAANALMVPIDKCIMALSYGDQLTNMIQPFWALPMLGITKIKAEKILPHTFRLMLIGLIVYGAAIWFW